MLKRILILCLLFWLPYEIWTTPAFYCVDFLVIEFCGEENKKGLLYFVFGLDVLLAIYLLLPFFAFSALKFTIRSKNTNK